MFSFSNGTGTGTEGGYRGEMFSFSNGTGTVTEGAGSGSAVCQTIINFPDV